MLHVSLHFAHFPNSALAPHSLSLAVGCAETPRIQKMDEFVVRGNALVEELPNIWDFLVPRLFECDDMVAQVGDNFNSFSLKSSLLQLKSRICKN